MKRVYTALAALAAALVGVIAWQAAQPSEPVYKGKPLSLWLRNYTTYDHYGWIYPRRAPQADEAVRQIGTNAIPTLLRLLRARDSALELKLVNLVRWQHVLEIKFTPADEWNLAAVMGFAALGTNAQSAVPALIEMATPSDASRICAIRALGYIGPSAKQAVPTLLRWAFNSDTEVSRVARLALYRVDPEAYAKAGITNTP